MGAPLGLNASKRRARTLAGVLVCAAAIGTAPRPVYAHHSASAFYDASRTVTLDGSITRIDWRNPHVFLYVAVRDGRGRSTMWSLETESPIALDRVGLRKGDLRVGDHVTAEVMPALHSPDRGRIRTLRYHGKRYVDTGLAAVS